MKRPPAPLEWHPAYEGHRWLADWLEGRPPYDTVVIPLLTRAEFGFVPDGKTVEPVDTRTLTMTKKKAWGPAPYVGRPFVYVWPVGEDNVGRMIAGESSIQYTEDRPWMY